MNLYLSKRPENVGGGGNTFAWNFARFLRARGIRLVSDLSRADRAIVFAHQGDPEELSRAKCRGVRIVHRLDEDFEQNDSPHRIQKHARIVEINRFAHVTVFQSRFVMGNVYPHIRPRKFRVIYNGTDFERFRPAARPGGWIGHVTWSAGSKKRLDLLHEFIRRTPNERFLLVGRQKSGPLDFSKFRNVRLLGPVPHRRMPAVYRKMKMLYMPSERDPCPNVVIEAISSGVPVCFNPSGGVPEIVRTCGAPLDRAGELLRKLSAYRKRCLRRPDLDFNRVARLYLEV